MLVERHRIDRLESARGYKEHQNIPLRIIVSGHHKMMEQKFHEAIHSEIRKKPKRLKIHTFRQVSKNHTMTQSQIQRRTLPTFHFRLSYGTCHSIYTCTILNSKSNCSNIPAPRCTISSIKVHQRPLRQALNINPINRTAHTPYQLIPQTKPTPTQSTKAPDPISCPRENSHAGPIALVVSLALIFVLAFVIVGVMQHRRRKTEKRYSLNGKGRYRSVRMPAFDAQGGADVQHEEVEGGIREYRWADIGRFEQVD